MFWRVRKKGVINVHMVFGRKQKEYLLLHTPPPFGTMQMGIAATRVKISEAERGQYIDVKVEVCAGG